ncbi:MAG: penicillin-binding transpeptidase domain-containing protein [Acidimicrobiales bacterium]
MEDSSRLRLRLLAVIAVSMFVALFGRLWYLQALESEEFQEVATQNITRTIRTQAARGRVFDRNGKVLVDNRLSTVVTVNREDLRLALVERGLNLDERVAFRSEMFSELARELSQSGQLTKLAGLERAYSDPSFSGFEDIPVARDVDEELLVFIGERPAVFPGVQVTQELVRSYPYGDRAAHILGYVGSITGTELETKSTRWRIPGPEGVLIEDPDGKPYRSNDEIGKVGIERFFEDDLRGVPGTQVIEVDNVGNLVRRIDELGTEPQQGSDVHLTIDIDIQAALEDELKRTLERAREVEAEPDEPAFIAPAGASVILDPRGGAVLAMASYPTFDPGDFIDGISQDQFDDLNDPVSHQPLLNRAIAEVYPAASTFKPFTAIAAEVYDVFGWEFVDDHDVFISDPGFWKLESCLITGGDTDALRAGGCIKRNAGDATMEGVDLQHSLTYSSDTYYYRIGEAFWIAPDNVIQPEGIQDVASDFGFGNLTGIQLAGEKAGYLPSAELMLERHESNPEAFPRGQWNPGDNTNIAIGQGEIAITPLQLANAYAVIANGGTVYAPNVVNRIQPQPGGVGVEVEFAPRVLREVEIPPTIAPAILDGLLGVTLQPKVQLDRPSGTAYDAFNDPVEGGVAFPLYSWPVAGKTGTAEIVGKADNSMFAGFGPSGSTGWGTPVLEPEYVMVTVLEESGFGSAHAAPMTARVFELFATDTVPIALTQDEVDEFYGVDRITDLEGATADDEGAGQ